MENSNLKTLAKELYFNNVLVDEYRQNFIKELEKRNVIDKRDQGYYCSYCKKFSATYVSFENYDHVIMPNNNEIWIVNAHYDGCRGWD